MFDKEVTQTQINNEFIDAVMQGNLEKVKEMFAEEHQPYIDTEINGVPVILYAAQKQDWAMVEELYNIGADLDAQNPPLQWHLIHECIKSAPDRVTKAVLEYCNINAQTKAGKTALMIAISENKIAMAEHLVDLGRMDLSICDAQYNNAAHYAAKHEQYDLFIKLCQAGAPVNKTNKEDQTPIDLITDVTFKENLPRVLGELAKIEKQKQNVESTETVVEVEAKAEEKKEEPIKPKVSGLSSIKRN
jgi:ankyrin repeat protein